MLKQHVVRWLRWSRLLALAEMGRLALAFARSYRANRRFRQQAPHLLLPPFAVAYDAFGAVDHATYWASGEQSAAMIHTLLSRHLRAPLTSVCEWGCGPGRVIRHLPACQPAGSLQVHGADYNPVSVRWCQRALPDVSVILCDLSPPLPYQDGQFDAVYAISVFTHLAAERHDAWLQELLRIVRPGGLLLMTLHGDRFRDRLLPEERRQYDGGRLVVRDRVKEGSRTFAAFHSPSFVRTAFLRDLPVVWHDPQSALTLAGGQDIWIVRRP